MTDIKNTKTGIKVEKTTYIVTGFMRTGTSMMMYALETGGLDAVKSPLRDKFARMFSDDYYSPNEHGLYEPNREVFNVPFFPKNVEGKLVKCLFSGLKKIIAGNYKIVFMVRDYEEIRQSLIAFFGKNNTNMTREKYETVMWLEIERLKNRKDVDFVVFNYRDVVDNPREHFQVLKDNGWDIDVEKAASCVTPELCRFKKEELIIGAK